MDKNKEKNPVTLSRDEIEEIYAKHQRDKSRCHYYDINGRLTWSSQDLGNLYTWYHYNAQGSIIEMGECYMNSGAIGKIITIRNQTSEEINEFMNIIRLGYGAINIRQRATNADLLIASDDNINLADIATDSLSEVAAFAVTPATAPIVSYPASTAIHNEIKPAPRQEMTGTQVICNNAQSAIIHPHFIVGLVENHGDLLNKSFYNSSSSASYNNTTAFSTLHATMPGAFLNYPRQVCYNPHPCRFRCCNSPPS